MILKTTNREDFLNFKVLPQKPRRTKSVEELPKDTVAVT
jgi:hypothetical protein